MEHKEGTKMIPSDILSPQPDFEQAPNVERALFPQLATSGKNHVATLCYTVY